MVSSTNSLPIILDAPAVKGKTVVTTTLSKEEGGLTELMELILKKRRSQEEEESFYILDLDVVASLYNKWSQNLDMIQPFYAVKCNPDTSLIGALATLGANFDCASRTEIETVLSLGVSLDRIIYSNPCKSESHIKYAASVGVNLTTFDSTDELHKIKKWHPKTDLVLRIKVDDTGATQPLGLKYGALAEEVEPLLQAAHAAQLKVIGVSFHIGSGAAVAQSFHGAIAAARTAFDIAVKLGLPKMTLLDIGGGFNIKHFDEAASVIKTALQTYFSNESGLTIISEPGQFFAASSFTLATYIIGKRVRGEVREYWLDEGVFGSFISALVDKSLIPCVPYACASNSANPKCEGLKVYDSTLFGPTADSSDTINTGYLLPNLQVNDWLLFPNLGAYSSAIRSTFNGFNTAAVSTYLTYSNGNNY